MYDPPALFFLLILDQIILCYVAIFGTGNVASISSFEIRATYRFVTVFRPFLMSAILVWKLTAPMILVCCAYSGLTKLLRVPQSAVFLLVVALAGILRLFFLRASGVSRLVYFFRSKFLFIFLYFFFSIVFSINICSCD